MNPKPQELYPLAKRLSRGRKAVTVCIGVVSEGALIGVSDRMLTAQNGEIEFETDQVKMWSFSNSIIALVAGDMSLQSEILHELDIEVKSWIRSDRSKWVAVKDIVKLYCQKVRELRREHAEREILYPLGLDFPSFFSLQNTMDPAIAESLKKRLLEFQLPETLETIFMGIDTHAATDSTGKLKNIPQLYTTYNDRASWLTTVGFGAIGTGRNHAETHLMYSAHWPKKPFSDALLLAYSAKKRAEAAPGVGKGTDMFVIGPGLGHTVQVEKKHLSQLANIYEEGQKKHEATDARTQKKTAELIESVRREYKERREEELKKKLPLPSSDSEMSEPKQ
jgi:hypothetical protein